MASVFDKTALKNDSATSSAVAFIMILAVLAVCAGVWALLVVPEEIRMKDEINFEAAVSVLSDIVLMSDRTDYTVYFALQAGTLWLANCGEVYTNNGESVPLTTLIYSPGKETSFGIMAGGVWRMDSGNAAWILYPKISHDSDTVRFQLPVFLGDAAYGSSKPIPLGVGLEENSMHTIYSNKLTVSANEEWAANLFATLFLETAYSYDALDIKVSQNGNKVTAEFSAKEGDICLELDEKRYKICTEDKI
ncbi:MAG: hypothetical protein IKY09_07310 [Methanocorpusculum sp.]|nr:hypothetical protein [Methanocorpusculum sp.]